MTRKIITFKIGDEIIIQRENSSLEEVTQEGIEILKERAKVPLRDLQEIPEYLRNGKNLYKT